MRVYTNELPKSKTSDATGRAATHVRPAEALL